MFVSDHCFTEVLLANRHTTLHIDPELEGPACGLVPFSQSVRATTRGLRWNLEPTAALELSWGGLLSTSNLVQQGCTSVYIHANHPVLWTIERR